MEIAVRIYTTCPPSKGFGRTGYVTKVAELSRWSDRAGCAGMLVYTDNGLVDPWLVAQVVIQNTVHLNPLVAVQPVYMHPYAAAKMVASIARLHGRSVHLNMVAGGFVNDLLALGDTTPHDDRYTRLVEYTKIVQAALGCAGPVTATGRYYSTTDALPGLDVPPDLLPQVLVSGSSPAGREAARSLRATAVKYPQPPGEEVRWMGDDSDASFGVRVGIIARETCHEAWRVAYARFPEDRQGRITHRMAMAVSDSHWHRQLAGGENRAPGPDGDEPDPYWLGPFQNYKTFCPYLVGSYTQVAVLLARYMELGARTFILDVPASEEELAHSHFALEKARESISACSDPAGSWNDSRG
jgi:alkanesulfonate monooxygenase